MALRYVVLRHEGIAEPHFDLMFETAPGSALATWRSPVWPPGTGTPLPPLPDHRADYLTYEGPVSRGRGAVRRVSHGTYRVLNVTATVLSVEFEGGTILSLPRAAR